jgi:hypothetical protein
MLSIIEIKSLLIAKEVSFSGKFVVGGKQVIENYYGQSALFVY